MGFFGTTGYTISISIEHLNKSGFVERSDYLLFAIVSDADTFFVDIRPHQDPEKLQWVRQDLLTIIHSNWPELINQYVLRGVGGSTVTDEQKKELRRKNVNLVSGAGPGCHCAGRRRDYV